GCSRKRSPRRRARRLVASEQSEKKTRGRCHPPAPGLLQGVEPCTRVFDPRPRAHEFERLRRKLPIANVGVCSGLCHRTRLLFERGSQLADLVVAPGDVLAQLVALARVLVDRLSNGGELGVNLPELRVDLSELDVASMKRTVHLRELRACFTEFNRA